MILPKLFNSLLLACLLISTAMANNPPGLIGDWKLDGDAVDSGPGSYDGTLVGTVAAPDLYNNPDSALCFDGIDDHIWLGDHAAGLQPDEVTILVWFRD